MGAKGGSQTVQQDNLTNSARQTYWDYLRGAAGLGGPDAKGGAAGAVPGMDVASKAALDQYGAAASAGQRGLAALGGDQAAFGMFMNPFQTNVLDQMQQQYGRLGEQVRAGVNDEATRAGAFGGSRHGVASGIAQGELASDVGRQMAGLQYQGFNDAMGRAGQLANLGMGASDRLNQMGEYRRQIEMSQDPVMRRLQILGMAQGGGVMAGGQQIPTQRNWMQGVAGGASAGAAMGGPGGAMLGGLFGGLFG